MILEAAQYKDNTFATLTYAPEMLPEDLCVWPRELQLFMKKLRKTHNAVIRFFGVGEYGEISGLPHYHLALFNYPNCFNTITRKSKYCCPMCDTVSKAWGKGHIQLGTLEPNSMAYVAGYINKKMTRKDDPRLEGRSPEFSRMSLRPGIGYGMMHDLASTLMRYGLDKKLIDVPNVLQHGMKQYPLGRYLRRSLRKMLGRHPNTPQEVMDEIKTEMQPMREAAFNASTPLKASVLSASLGRRIQIAQWAKRKKKVHVI
ncbi:replication initiator protein [robinz microvirus RP_56]|nr:replication initiator protein [robinz microvirus RP_56]